MATLTVSLPSISTDVVVLVEPAALGTASTMFGGRYWGAWFFGAWYWGKSGGTVATTTDFQPAGRGRGKGTHRRYTDG